MVVLVLCRYDIALDRPARPASWWRQFLGRIVPSLAAHQLVDRLDGFDIDLPL